MSKVILHIATSLDGYIATEQGGVNWLDELAHSEGEDYGYADFYKEAGCLIMGRKTYEDVQTIAPEWPYPDRLSYIVSTNQNLAIVTPNTQLLTGDIGSAVKKLQSQTTENIWLVGGGRLLSSFLESDLVDELMIYVAPVLLGAGIRLFPAGIPKRSWTLNRCDKFASGMVELHYKRTKMP